MKYALFALAALLLLFGGYCVITGLASADTERGWLSVISGTTLIVGSGIILALGWTIQTLEQIRGLLQTGDATAVAGLAPKQVVRRERAVAVAETHTTAPLAWPPHTSPLPPPVPASVEAEEPATDEIAAEEDRREIFAAEAQEIASAPLDERPVPEPVKAQSSFKDMWRRVGKETTAKPSRLEPSRPEPLSPEPLRPVSPPPMPAPASASASAPGAPPVPPPMPMERPRPPMFGAKPPPNATPPSAPAPSAPAPIATPPGVPPSDMPPPPPPMHAPPMHEVEFTAEQNDWLDHALAELDSAIADAPFTRRAEPEPAAPELPRRPEPEKPAAAKPPSPPPAHAESVSEPLAPPLAEDIEPAADLASLAHEPAVIGRYEAEGTTYVMFADGSIEAQSERGVARFKSMADLKAYFETQEAPQ